jgi:predicted nucleotidyltransferase
MERKIAEYDFFKKLETLPFVEKIILFGSRARGDGAPCSDIDLAVWCPGATEEDWYKVMDIIDNADTLLEIDCVRLDTETNQRFRENIEKYQKVLYTK